MKIKHLLTDGFKRPITADDIKRLRDLQSGIFQFSEDDQRYAPWWKGVHIQRFPIDKFDFPNDPKVR